MRVGSRSSRRSDDPQINDAGSREIEMIRAGVVDRNDTEPTGSNLGFIDEKIS